MKRKIYPTLLVLWCILPMFWMSLRASPNGQEAAPIEDPFAFQDPSLPDSAPLTRAQAAALSVRTLKIREQGDLQAFSDVPAGAWYQKELAQAVAAGLFEGYQGLLRPEDPITRQEAGIVLSRLLSLEENEEKLSDLLQNRPRESLSRGEFLRLANSLLPQSLEPGAQDWEIQGSVLLSFPGNYSRLVIDGDLVISEGAEGQVFLQDALISGRVLIRSGGQIQLKGRVQTRQIEIAPSSSRLRLDCQTEQPLALENHGDLAYLDGKFSTISLSKANSQTLFAGQAQTVSLLENGVCFQALPGCGVSLAHIQGSDCMVLGQGRVDQATVSGENARIDIADTAVFLLAGAQSVWVGDRLLTLGGSLQPSPPEKKKPENTPSFPGVSGPSRPPEAEKPEEPADSPSADSVRLDRGRSDSAILGLETEAKGEVLTLRLQSEALLSGKLPDGLEDYFHQRQPDGPFAAVALIFQPPEGLEGAETATISYSSSTLLQMGYGPADSTDAITYQIENGILQVERRFSASELAEGLPLILPFSYQKEQIPICINWGEDGPRQNYLLETGGVPFQLLSQPEVQLKASETGPELEIRYNRACPVEESRVSIGLAGQTPWVTVDLEDLDPQEIQLDYAFDWQDSPIFPEENWQVTVEEKCWGQWQSVQWQGQFSMEQLLETLPDAPEGKPAFDFFCPESDFLTPTQQDQLFAMWEAGDGLLDGLIQFDPGKNLLSIQIGQTEELEHWLQENLGRPELPIGAASVPLLPGVQLEDDWLSAPILWLDAECFASPALYRLSAEGLPPLFLSFCDEQS